MEAEEDVIEDEAAKGEEEAKAGRGVGEEQRGEWGLIRFSFCRLKRGKKIYIYISIQNIVFERMGCRKCCVRRGFILKLKCKHDCPPAKEKRLYEEQLVLARWLQCWLGSCTVQFIYLSSYHPANLPWIVYNIYTFCHIAIGKPHKIELFF